MTERPLCQVFIAIGGTGSRYLIESLVEHGFDVGDKPDYTFRHQMDGWSMPGLWPNSKTFADRSGFTPHDASDPRATLREYVAYLRHAPNRLAILNTFSEMGLFSDMKLTEVTALTRNPLHAYLSWAKAERHGAVIDRLGGTKSAAAIDFYIDRWCRPASEILRLSRLSLLAGVIRYEHAVADARRLGLGQIYENFKVLSDYSDCESGEIAARITARTNDLCCQLDVISGATSHPDPQLPMKATSS